MCTSKHQLVKKPEELNQLHRKNYPNILPSCFLLFKIKFTKLPNWGGKKKAAPKQKLLVKPVLYDLLKEGGQRKGQSVYLMLWGPVTSVLGHSAWCTGSVVRDPSKIWTKSREFPGGPVVRNWLFHCQGLGSIQGRGTKILHQPITNLKTKYK